MTRLSRLVLLCGLIGASASAQLTSYSEGDRKVGYLGATPQGQGVIPAVTLLNQDGTAATIGSGGGGSTRTTAAGTSDTLAVPVQGVTGGVPQNVAQSGAPWADNITAVGGTALTLGQKTAAASIPVTLASDGTYSTSALQTAGNTSLSTLITNLGSPFQANASLGAGTNLIGKVGIDQTTPGTTNNVTIGGTTGTAANTANGTADGTSAATIGLYINGRSYLFNGTSWDRARGDTTGTWMGGHATVATGQVSVGTTATLVAAARTGRQKIAVTVTTAVQCAFGASGVTLTTGWPLAAVAYVSDNWDTGAALYGVCASTATVGYREQF